MKRALPVLLREELPICPEEEIGADVLTIGAEELSVV